MNGLVGIAPLFAARNRQDEPACCCWASIEVSDYLDVIARPADLPAFFAGLLPYLAALEQPRWQVLDWYNLLEHSPSLPALAQAAAQLGWSYTQERLQHSPYIALPGDWETYLGSIDKKPASRDPPQDAPLEESGLPTRWYLVRMSQPGRRDRCFMDLMTQDADKAAFLTPPMRQLFASVTRCAFQEKCLNLAFLEISGKKAAAYLNFDYLNRLWIYNSGVDRDFMEYSPGWVLLGYLLRWANEHHIKEFDFMRGDEEYKYRFGAIDRFVVRAVVRPPQ